MRRALIALSSVAALAAFTGCDADMASDDGRVEGDIPGPMMLPGSNCLRCHGAINSPYPEAPAWAAGGTVFPCKDAETDEGVPGVTVEFMDDNGTVVKTVTTNEVGNFFTTGPLPDPFRVAIELDGVRREMPHNPPAGSCNACHSLPPVGEAPGRIYIDALDCE